MKIQTKTISKTINQQFATDIRRGLSMPQKQLPSRYFYDERGDKIFQQIMNMPEYYLTDCEFEIFQTRKKAILDAIPFEEFDLVELGAGDGTKTKVLLEYFQQQKRKVIYRPVDISNHVLLELEQDLKQQMPELAVSPLHGEYFEVLEHLSKQKGLPKVVLFLGANIGNFPRKEAFYFLEKLGAVLESNDLLLIGFDLKKDPQTILDAYNDPAGITASFNLNLLHRINAELDGDIDVNAFKHWETYNPVTGETKSYIISTKDQDIYLKAIGSRFHFDAWETIEVELSQKYSIPEVEELLENCQLDHIKHFFDSRNYFVDSLWKKQPE